MSKSWMRPRGGSKSVARESENIFRSGFDGIQVCFFVLERCELLFTLDMLLIVAVSSVGFVIAHWRRAIRRRAAPQASLQHENARNLKLPCFATV